jgi:hypothetical protein
VSTLEDLGIVTTAKAESTSEGTTALAATIIQAPEGALDVYTAAAAVANLEYVTDMLGVADVEAGIMINASRAPTVTLTGGALEEFAETDLGLRFAFADGTLHYDADATRTLSEHDEVEVSLSKDDESILTDAQRAVLGDASFVSVTAMAGQTYIKELDGTVSITYVFGNPEGWKDFAAYHIAEDGTKTLKEYTYNEGTGQVTIYSDHHSVYAMLEEPSGSGSGSNLVWIAAGIVAVLAIAAVAYFAMRSKKA